MTRSSLPLLFPLALLVACGDKDSDDTGADGDGVQMQELGITFDARFGDTPAACGVDLNGVGTTASTAQLQDLKLYVHDLVLLDASGGETPLELDDDGLWQDGSVALLDFEDGSGLCANGTADLNAVVRGQAPEGAYTGLRFTIGVPFELNHADPAAAASPLNLTTMHWSWQGGYKFLRMDLSTAGLPAGWFVHLGSTGCEADADGVVTGCSTPNRVEVEVDLDPMTGVVVLDFASLLETSDVDADGGGAQGCMSAPDDPECPAIMERLGLVDEPQALCFGE